LVWEKIGGSSPRQPYGNNQTAFLKNLAPGHQSEIGPETKVYSLQYDNPSNPYGPISARVVVYPNAQWAHYEALTPPFTAESKNIKVARHFGNIVYEGWGKFYWPSGDKMVELECGSFSPSVYNPFLEPYLQKFPSDL
jgi:hypothetical protein